MNQEPEIKKIKTIDELMEYLKDWNRQCTFATDNMKVDVARAVRDGNFPLVAALNEKCMFFAREQTICMHLMSLVEVGGIQLATEEDLKRVKAGSIN